MFDQQPEIDIAVDYTVNVVASYVRGNHVAASELPALIGAVHAAIVDLGKAAASVEADVAKPSPAEIRKSIRPDGLVSFIDGRSYKTLKRHLNGNGLDPHAYRQRFGLPADYPMVSADYSARRSAISKAMGLGRSPRPLQAVA
ncbi:MucR family transcriptional regulator [Methylobacterium pseudosasicola]|uniref:Transcriptional regulator, MucR family n=1 Tax=Methylobacterium pseudosasicola TaxID=582667 RepID=A0A1I4UQY6_9HYPH|nr:MucR family transcriptional regulator [Methylobacterium pseudosasicola]SFM91372.1 transcriptional regulator, MucR family [Methylobacterium pseudosasicola]